MIKHTITDGINAPDLTDKNKPWGVIRFIHTDGKEHEFYSVVNEMSGDRLAAFDSDAPSIEDDLVWSKSVFRDIRNRAIKVIGYSGTKHFA